MNAAPAPTMGLGEAIVWLTLVVVLIVVLLCGALIGASWVGHWLLRAILLGWHWA